MSVTGAVARLPNLVSKSYAIYILMRNISKDNNYI
jgi:hypothetical protein